MISIAFSAGGFVLITGGYFAMSAQRIKKHQMFGLWALAYVCYLISAVIDKNNLAAAIFSSLLALFVWLWWTGGGDDDTKRRLKKIASRFSGVRRTAPQGA